MRRGSASRGGPPSSRCAWASPSGPSSGWTTASSPCSSGCWRSGWLLSKLLAAALLIIGADGLDFEAFGTAGGAMRAPPLYIAALGIVEWFIKLPGGPLLMAVACSPPLFWGLRLWLSKKIPPPPPTDAGGLTTDRRGEQVGGISVLARHQGRMQNKEWRMENGGLRNGGRRMEDGAMEHPHTEDGTEDGGWRVEGGGW